MAKTDEAPTNAGIPDGMFETHAPTIILTEGQWFTGQFQKVTRGPENAFGTPLIVTFKANGGIGTTNTGEVFTVDPGEDYSFWLIHQTIRDAFIDARPAVGEDIAVASYGEKLSKTRVDSKGDPQRYHDERLALPGRVKADVSVDWDALSEPE